MITVDEALAAVLGRVRTLGTEATPLADFGVADPARPGCGGPGLPPFHRAAMDGFTVRSIDVTSRGRGSKVTGQIRAGVWPDRALGSGEAMRIMTGAPVPEGADAVVQVERTTMTGAGEVLIGSVVSAGQNIVPRGSEAVMGRELVRPVPSLGSAHLAVLASVGVPSPSSRVGRASRSS